MNNRTFAKTFTDADLYVKWLDIMSHIEIISVVRFEDKLVITYVV